jgi:hypothetical protein
MMLVEKLTEFVADLEAGAAQLKTHAKMKERAR